MLVAGLIYGFRRRRELAIIEHEFRIRETKRKAELAKVLAEEKVIANAGELFSEFYANIGIHVHAELAYFE